VHRAVGAACRQAAPAQTAYAAKFATPYLLATGFVHGGVGLGAFTEAAIRDPQVAGHCRQGEIRNRP